jgi:cell division protein FtsB
MSDGDERDVEIARLRQENDRLRAENAALRPRVSELEHKIRCQVKTCDKCEYHPHPEQDRA